MRSNGVKRTPKSSKPQQVQKKAKKVQPLQQTRNKHTINNILSSNTLTPVQMMVNKRFIQKRQFSTADATTNTTTTTTPATSSTTTDATDSAVNELETQRLKFKTIVSTMNTDQQMVVQALVAESSMLRGELRELGSLVQKQQQHAINVMAQLNDIKNTPIEGKNDQQQQQSQQPTHDDGSLNTPEEEYKHLDINSPTFLEDLIAIERNPRVKQSLMRENQLRKEIKPLIQLMEVAAAEKQQWTKRSGRTSLALFALCGIVIGQTILLYLQTQGADVPPPSITGGVAAISQTENVYLQEAVNIIQHYEQQLNNPNTATTNTPTTTTTTAPASQSQSLTPSAKWSVFKEKIRLYNLANPKHTIQMSQSIE